MDYNKQDIEFAFTILNHREMLDDEEVTEWLKDPAHLALMTDITVIRQKLSNRDYKKMKKEVGLHIRQEIRNDRNLSSDYLSITVLVFLIRKMPLTLKQNLPSSLPADLKPA